MAMAAFATCLFYHGKVTWWLVYNHGNKDIKNRPEAVAAYRPVLPYLAKCVSMQIGKENLASYAAKASCGCLLYSLAMASDTVKQVSSIYRQSFSTEGSHFR